MKIIFNKSVLLNAIVPAMSAISTKNTIPATEGILLKTENGKCLIASYDLEKGIKIYIDANIVREGSCIINAQKLFQIVRCMPEENVTIDVNEKMIASIKSGNAEFEIHALKGSDFPNTPELNEDNTFSLEQSILRAMITKTSFSIAVDNPRPVLNGAFFQVKNSKITIVTCDGNRLALRENLCDIEKEIEYSFIVPGKTITELVKLLNDNEEKVRISLTRKHVLFNIDEVMFFSRLIEGEYLDYEKIMPKNNTTFVEIDASLFKEALERASLVTEDRTLGQAKSHVKCSFEDQLLKISSVSVTGKVYDEIPTEKEGNDITIGFNCRYLLDALKACSEETIRISMSSPIMVMIIEEAEKKENSRFVYFVCPVKMQD